MKPMRE